MAIFNFFLKFAVLYFFTSNNSHSDDKLRERERERLEGKLLIRDNNGQQADSKSE